MRLKQIGAAVLVAVALIYIPVPALTTRSSRSNQLLWAVWAREGTEFDLTWTHTVTLRPVTETYGIEPGPLLHLRQMVFDQYGPNLPAGPEAGTTWRVEPDRFVVTGYQVRLQRLDTAVSPIAHTLRIGGRELDLIAGIGPDRLIRIEAERVPLAFILISEVRQWRNAKRRF